MTAVLRAAALRAAVLALGLVLVAPRAGAAQTGPHPGTLGAALRRALDVHPSVRASVAAEEASAARRAAARSARLPGVAVDGGVTRFEEPMLVAPLHRFDPAAVPAFDATLLRGTLGATWTLFDGGRRGAEIRRADELADASTAGRLDVEAALLEQTAAAYLAVLSSRERVAAQTRREEALDAELERARRQFQEGAAPRLEVLRAEAEQASARADGEAARREAELAVATLARILDLDPATLRDASLDVPGLPAGAPPAALPTGEALASLLDDAPAVARARRAASAADAGADAARAAWLPSVGAALGYNLYGGGDSDAVAEWQAGLQVSYPIFTGGARRAAVDGATAEAVRARAEVELARERSAQTADAARAAEVEARARLTALEAAVARYAELSRVERLALDEGAGVQSDWLRAEAGLFQARAALADVRHAVLRARLAWGRAVGRLDLTWIESLLETDR